MGSEIKAETGGNPVRERMATYPLTMASQTQEQTRKGEKRTMARERMVTRTVVAVNYTVMVVNITDRSVHDLLITIPSGDILTDKAREKAIKERLTENQMFVSITGETTTETLYGMTEQEFIKLAKVLPPRTKTE